MSNYWKRPDGRMVHFHTELKGVDIDIEENTITVKSLGHVDKKKAKFLAAILGKTVNEYEKDLQAREIWMRLMEIYDSYPNQQINIVEIDPGTRRAIDHGKEIF